MRPQQEPRRDEPAAAPPDDGGGQGSFTTPGDVLQVRSEERGERSPPLPMDVSAPPEEITGARSTIIVLAGMAVIVLVLFLVFLL